MTATAIDTLRAPAFSLAAAVRSFAEHRARRRAQRAQRRKERELIRAVARMADLSPHLLDDIGIGVAAGFEMIGRRA
jgi:uncharacterized protein YjiS (DUF1127 family)